MGDTLMCVCDVSRTLLLAYKYMILFMQIIQGQ